MSIPIYFFYVLAFYLIVTLILQIIFWSAKQIWSYGFKFFNPDKMLSNEVLNEIDDKAMDMVWQLHRVGNEPHPTEYYDFYQHIYEQRYVALIKETKNLCQ